MRILIANENDSGPGLLLQAPSTLDLGFIMLSRPDTQRREKWRLIVASVYPDHYYFSINNFYWYIKVANYKHQYSTQ